jgi:uncharacterized protein (DUF488 family)
MMLFTIGHSNISWEQFLFLLKEHGITTLADVRRLPRSRWPQFNQAVMARRLANEGITYAHIERLGSMREITGTRNDGWRKEPILQGFADYMPSAEFKQGIDELLALQGRVAFMCSEGKWEKCHRRLIADYLVVHGIEVRHIVSADPPIEHKLTEFARMENGEITYPGYLNNL